MIFSETGSHFSGSCSISVARRNENRPQNKNVDGEKIADRAHAAGAALALRHRSAGGADGGARRHHAAHGLGALDHRVEAGHRHRAAAFAGRLAGGVREIQINSAVPASQFGHELARIQIHLRVGMEPSRAWAVARGRISRALFLVCVARARRSRARLETRRIVCAGRAARRDRLVDGGVGA